MKPTHAAEATRSRARFCEYLRAQREATNTSLEQIATKTRIPERSLRLLEAGTFESLPADVFVRGFLRSYAGCLGLDADEIVKRYAACGLPSAPVAAEVGPGAAPELEPDPATLGVVRLAAGSTERPAEPAVLDAAPRAAAPDAPTVVEAASTTRARGRVARGSESGGVPATSRKVRRAKAAAARAMAAVVIEDHPPTSAERRAMGADRRARAEATTETIVERRTVERRALVPSPGLAEAAPSRGPLTLAVIVLVIVATLAMSYLLRDPTGGGDGITRAPAAALAPRG
jgi:hypothetical protein